MVELMNVPGVGPEDGEAPLRQGRRPRRRLRWRPWLERDGSAVLPGIKAKTEANILKGIAIIKRGQERMPLAARCPWPRRSPPPSRKLEAVDRLEPGRIDPPPEGDGGRRGHPRDVLEARGGHGHVCRPAPGPRRARARRDQGLLRHREGIQIDLRVVEPAAFGAALEYFTGSKQHNIRIREMAVRRD